MQQRGCEELQLLISKYVDDAATPEEREAVDLHTVVCDKCACKLTEYMEMAAIFCESPLRAPDPYLRDSLFQQIDRLREEERRKEEVKAREDERRVAWRVPPQLSPTAGRGLPLALRLWKAASPFAAASVAIFVLVGFLAMGARLPEGVKPEQLPESSRDDVRPPPYVPTVPATLIINADQELPTPPETKVAGLASPNPVASAYAVSSVHASSTSQAAATLQLLRSEAVMEGDVANGNSWHSVRDPRYGYSLSYPPNWWTQAQGNMRFFYPWSEGGTKDAPYFISVRVEANTQNLDAESARHVLFGGKKCEVIPSGRNRDLCLRRQSRDANNSYDELYSFDARYIYTLKLSVPWKSERGSFDRRWDEAQAIFSRMSGSMSLASHESHSSSKDQVVFLNGTDLWAVSSEDGVSKWLTRGYGVRQFALSSNGRDVAFTAMDDPNDLWDKRVYLTTTDASSVDKPTILWSASDVHSIAWYGDHVLLAIAKTTQDGLGVYRIDIGSALAAAQKGQQFTAKLVKALDKSLSGAKSLAVSPDRQLVTFLAPLGENEGTSIYALRPDGTDLRRMVSHLDPLAPTVNGELALLPGQQAIKSYLWADGRLEPGGYEYKLILTCGNSESPTRDKGGFLYAAPNALRYSLFDPVQNGADRPARLQIIHLAYSTYGSSGHGRLAMTGYYNDYNNRADQLVGLWTADFAGDALVNVQPQLLPETPRGITDLQWSPDGTNLIYRETMPTSPDIYSARYDGRSPFRIIKLDPVSRNTTVLYDSSR